MKTISLNGTWSLRGRPQEAESAMELLLDAQVPGCVQLDLSRQGYLPSDLFLGKNIVETENFEGYQWWYSRTFTAPKERENVFLTFEGVDCIAEYFLNDVSLGESRNMFVSHAFPVGHLLRDGENTLTVHIKSSVIDLHSQSYPLVSMMSWASAPTETGLRRAAHTYGWDIMPRAVTAGLWRDVKLEVRDKLYFSQLYFKATRKNVFMLFEIDSKWSDFKDVEIEVEGACGDSQVYARRPILRGKAGRIHIPIENPKLWWPYGYGEPNVYDVTVRIYAGGQLVHEEPSSFGVRDVVFEQADTTDGFNGKFRFLINGEEIMVKGTNWVPLDAFHSRDHQRYDEALALLKDFGVNMVRCWGGNIYPEQKFYDFCDRNGIMVWQDFAMACRIYPMDDGFMKQMEEEAIWVVKEFRNHPSLVLWCGDNEEDMVTCIFTKPSINRITRELLPRVIAQHDMDRPYHVCSPYISDTAAANRQAFGTPEDHLWSPKDYFKAPYYKDSRAHFVSETGYHGCPAWESLQKMFTPDKLWPYQNNSQWILHSSDQAGNDDRVMRLEYQMRMHFGSVPTDPEEFVLASQITQAEACKYFMERIRVNRPRKTGILLWNLLDGWPQISDAVVDYFFTKKLAYHYIKRSQAPFCIIADEPAGSFLSLYACNDTLQEKTGHFTVTDAVTGEVLIDKDFTAKENTNTYLDAIPVCLSDHRLFFFRWEVEGQTGFNHYLLGNPAFDFGWYKRFIKELSV